MNSKPSVTRRQFVSGMTIAGGFVVGAPAYAAFLPTPRQNEGPFYPVKIPLDHDNDLIQVTGRSQRAEGEAVHLLGRVLDLNGKPVLGAQIEIWQCDAQGRYHHPGERHGQADPNFQGFGRTLADKSGSWRFRTIKPVTYPGRVPHIHFGVSGRGIERLTTQMYLKDHTENNSDWIFTSVPSEAERQSLLVEFVPIAGFDAPVGNFTIVLGGNTRAG
ncbi:MAG: intradiol ring-cleavage dioxygenase [Rhodospirillaceae bacterium]|nr:intradiol ring-cleavage dioxygenase [Rhodospirillaceae bacterium]|tara:strand:+ start:6752 stop:7402 length:651 start_codon:yes stop_codon:yes gene_type:complete